MLSLLERWGWILGRGVGHGGGVLLTSKDVSLEVHNGKRWCHAGITSRIENSGLLGFVRKKKINQKVIKMKNTKMIQKDEIRCKKAKFCILKIEIFRSLRNLPVRYWLPW